MTFNMGYATASLIFLGIFGALLAIKLSMKRYDPVVYWLVFTSTSIAGTAICDYMDRTLGLGYGYGSLILIGTLLLILFMWHKAEKSISVEWITTKQSEIFYWIAFLVANTLGTAAGDYLADDLGVGFAGGALIIGAILAMIAGLHYYTKISSILLFWLAFVLTRPFGATFGDFLTKTHDKGGLDLGTIGSSLFFVVLLIALVAYEHKKHRKIKS